MRLPQKDGKIDYPAAEAMVDLAMKSGCNYFDTAYIYHGGESEKFAGDILSRYPRESFYLASKMTVWIADSPSDIERIFQEQLERCHTDYFDYYLLHSVNESVWQKSLDFKVLDFLKQKKAEGRIRKLGFSFHDTPEFLRKVVAAYPWDFAQIQLNYLDWDLSRAGEQYEILTQAGVPVIIMEPVRGGALASLCPEANALLKGAAPDLGIASWALRYAASLPNVLCVLSGMSDKTQLLDNIGTFSPLNCLTESEQNILSQAIEVHKKYLADIAIVFAPIFANFPRMVVTAFHKLQIAVFAPVNDLFRRINVAGCHDLLAFGTDAERKRLMQPFIGALHVVVAAELHLDLVIFKNSAVGDEFIPDFGANRPCAQCFGQIFKRFPQARYGQKKIKLALNAVVFNIVHLAVNRKQIKQAAHVVIMRVRYKNRFDIEKIQFFEIARM
jgi:aryl-alcohol dehydrogenase-like predicted oxidoreductase